MKNRLRFAIRFATAHFLISLGIAIVSAALVFMVWYPGVLAKLTSVTKIYWIVLGVDVTLGPLLTLIVASPKKGLRERISDFAVIGLIQIAALIYGMSTVFDGRPAYIVYNVDRFDVVAANDLDEEDIKTAKPEYQKLSFFGPKLVAAIAPSDPDERNKLTLSSLDGGKDLPQLPKYYLDYADVKQAAIDHSLDLSVVREKNPDQLDKLQKALTKTNIPEEQIRVLIIKVKNYYMTALIDKRDAHLLEIVDLKSWN
ncbi:TfpX/TfpZ family type IV pilin accessory protein [Ampullimonas aquatilis]|uniref:TfpX/TfpZ family type IV pilin accessory protein n=1 Tax=Ampullimonas aquatilis TaxID=1341549 RepID=UPI003C78684E